MINVDKIQGSAVKRLTSDLLYALEDYFSDQKHQEEFEAWKAEREKEVSAI